MLINSTLNAFLTLATKRSRTLTNKKKVREMKKNHIINCSNLLQNFATHYSCHPNHCGLCSKPNNAISWGIPKAQMSFVCVALLCFDLLACAKTSVLCGNGRTKLQADFVTQSFSKWSTQSKGGFICTSPSWLSVTSSSSQCCWTRMIECYQFRWHFAEPQKR